MAKVLMKSGLFHPFQLTTLLILAVSVCSENVFDADFSLIPRLGGAVRTTMSTAYGPFNSSLAIDGMVGNPDACFCCSIANGQTSLAWLEIDLGQQYYITGIKIYGRNDATHVGQSTDIDVFIGNRSLSHQTLSDPFISIHHGTSIYPYTKQSTTPWRFQVFLIRKRSADFLTICEVQFREDANIINQVRQTIQTEMSSTYVETNKRFTADLAVDGDARTNANTCNCCSATKGGSVPWWQLDLRRKYLITRMELIGTTDDASHSRNVGVYISNLTLLNGNSPMTSNESLFSVVDNFSGYLFSTNKTAIFQFLMIRRWNPSILTICELKLYTQECDQGRYGEGCLHSCHCFNNTQCDAATGKCPNGCIPGYTGAACETACSGGLFGRNCTNQCGHCSQNSPCDKVDGHCASGCAPGYVGQVCKTECGSGTFGQNCSGVAHCINSTDSNHINGSCIEGICNPGWRKEACDIECMSGTFGQNCSGIAHCLHGTANNNVNGSCIEGVCDPGWRGDACDTVCESGTFGQNCSGVAHCINGTTNNNVNGSCTEVVCDPGWRGDACDTVCVTGRFGRNCSGEAHCINGTANNNVNGSCQEGVCDPRWTGEACDTMCDPGTFGLQCSQRCNCYNDRNCTPGKGICPDVEPRCVPGWKGRSCDKECYHGTFGQSCAQLCHCLGGGNCTPADGICPDVYPRCARGWQGRSCDKACKAYFFGLSCSEECGGCKHGAPCDPESGICPNGCAEGYIGDTCTKITKQDQVDSTSSDSKLVGPIVGGSSAIVACLVVVSILLIMIFRRKQRRDTNHTSNTDNVYTQPNLNLTATEPSVYDTLDNDKYETIEKVESSHDYVNEQMETDVL